MQDTLSVRARFARRPYRRNENYSAAIRAAVGAVKPDIEHTYTHNDEMYSTPLHFTHHRSSSCSVDTPGNVCKPAVSDLGVIVRLMSSSCELILALMSKN